MKLCGACRQYKPEGEFSRKGSGFQTRCKACFTEYHRLYYEKNRERYAAKNRRNKARQRERLRSILWEAKQRPCADCGQTFHPWVMEFDHRDGSDKLDAVADLAGHGCTDARLLAEISKCDVVCANRHRMRTFRRHHGEVLQSR